MKIFLFLLSLVIPFFLHAFLGKYLWNIPYGRMRIALGLVFLILSGFFIKHQRYFLAFLFFVLSLAFTTRGELFFEDGR